MKVQPLALPGALLIQLPRWQDDRGFFVETFRVRWAGEINLPAFVQDNLSFSQRGILRGLHFQRPPAAQAKLITVIQGTIQDVIVDLRPNSPTYKQWLSVTLSSEMEEWQWLYVPEGFAHGFLVLSETAHVWYRCSAYYAPTSDAGVRWNDPELGIAWRLEDRNPILSQKDSQLPLLKDLDNPFL
jgi:dTDP-4-dehydrorhamnose 3,5-epimerase